MDCQLCKSGSLLYVAAAQETNGLMCRQMSDKLVWQVGFPQTRCIEPEPKSAAAVTLGVLL